MLKIIEAQGFSASDPDIINKVAKYIQQSATYNLNYNTAIDRAENPVIAFLTEGEGVCRHYAKAATLLFRSMGIPARYTQGFVGDVKNGETVSITDETAHAWVEVYVADIGWVRVEVTGSSAGDEDDEDSSVIIIKPQDYAKDYDGKPLVAANSIEATSAFWKLISKGYTYDVTVSGSITQPGRAESVIEKFVLYDPQGNDVTDQFIKGK